MRSDVPRQPLRLWPGVLIVALMLVTRLGLPLVFPQFTAEAVLAGLVGGVAIILWWLGFSRAAWADRLGAIALMALAMFVAWAISDVSMATGAMGALLPVLALPGLCVGFVGTLVLTRRLADGPRRAIVAAVIILACLPWALVRTGGFTGSFDNDLAWRWAPTPEELLVARGEEAPAPPSPAPAVAVPSDKPSVPPVSEDSDSAREASAARSGAAPDGAGAAASSSIEWPGFRGADRDGIVRGVRIDTNWAAAPPVELWRRPIGPGWSSFAVHGDIFYTQEQRGDDEIVAAYRVSTGAPVWKHRDAARFWESNGGAGPRGTPTISNGRIYAFGATGILNALNEADGRVVWSRNVSTDSHRKVPDWGFASSPLLVDDLVIIAAEGKLMAYDVATGMPRWSGPEGGLGYSSPHLRTIDGVPQILLLNGGGATSVAPADGHSLWTHMWTSSSMSAPIVQPAFTAEGDLLIGDGQGSSMRRVTVTKGPGGWNVGERWVTTSLKPFFNDFVVHEGHAFGFDGAILACIDLHDGSRKWKGGRYGNGQLVLLADQDVLLVLSEEGELALVSATTDKFTELARVPAISGKTWNHPVLAGDVLLVRNGEEMAAFRLTRTVR